MNAKAKPGIAIWGVGSHARRNLIPAVIESPWSLVGLLSRNRKVVEEIAAPLGVRIYANAGEMLADRNLSAVLLAGPNGVHYEQAKAVLHSGKAALVEKSFCARQEQAVELTTLAQQHRLLIAECFSYAYHPQFEQLKTVLQGGGKLASLTARFGFPFRDRSDIRYRADLAGGALLDVGAYCLSAMCRLVSGPARVKWARMDSVAGYEVDTGGQAVVEMADSVIGLCDWGFGRAYRNEIEAWSGSASVHAERIFAKPAGFGTVIRVVHQQDNRLEDIAVPPHNSFVAMLAGMVPGLDDGAIQASLRAEILKQAALVHDVRRHAGF